MLNFHNFILGIKNFTFHCKLQWKKIKNASIKDPKELYKYWNCDIYCSSSYSRWNTNLNLENHNFLHHISSSWRRKLKFKYFMRNEFIPWKMWWKNRIISKSSRIELSGDWFYSLKEWELNIQMDNLFFWKTLKKICDDQKIH